MNWQAALQDQVFLTFFWVCLGLLGTGGVVLAAMRLCGKRLGHAWSSYRGWLIMAPLFVGVVFAGREATIGFLALVGIMGFKEFAKATGLYRDWWMTITVYVGILGVAATAWAEDPTHGLHGWFGMFLAAPVYVVALIFLVPILRDRVQGQLQAMALATIGFMYIGWMFGHLAFLVNSPHAYGYLLYLVIAVEVADVAAYVTGKLVGHLPLRGNISPNKTLGGSLGALGVSMILPFCCQFALPHFSNVELLITGGIVGIGGQLGDLSISVIKRDLGVKDMGALIPGHGGVLDRIDSLIFTAPMFFHTVHYFHGIYT